MKRMFQIVAIAVVALLVPVVATTPALAVATCEVGFTGPDSQNMCTSVEEFTCEVSNENSVVIMNTNGQNAASGTVTVGENGTGSGAVSGNAGNYASTTFTVNITNAGENQVCSAVVKVPATETPPTVVPTAPEATTPTASTRTPAKVLPKTGADTTLSTLAMVAGMSVAVAGVSVVSAAVYRRMNVS